MSALLVKDAPEGLHQWLKSEASFNRRSLNQQILICLEWCMRSYGEAQRRDPFAPASTASLSGTKRAYPRGRDLADVLLSMESIDEATAEQMAKDARALRKKHVREFDYACFA